MQEHISNNKLFTPLYIWLIYSISTIVIFEFGPLQFPVENKFSLYLYLFGAHLAIILGYYSGFRKLKGLQQDKLKSRLISKKWLNIISFIVFFGILFSFFRDYLAGASLSVASEDAYKAREDYGQRAGGVTGYIGTIFDVFVLPYLAIGIINFKSLNKLSKFVLIFLIFRILYDALIGSTRSGILLLLIVLFFSFLPLIYTNQIKISLKKFLAIVSFTSLLSITYGSYISIARQVNTTDAKDYIGYMANPDIHTYEFDKNNFFIPELSGDLQLINIGILTGYFYFTHAYYGLSNAINVPFIGTTFFFGHSDFTIRNLSRIFGEDILDYSYHYRLVNEDLHAETLWITAYAWIASDTTFVGSLFLLYFLASLFAKSWIRVLKSPTMVASALFAWLAYFFFTINITFVPADLGAFISFWGLILMFQFKLKSTSRRIT